MNGLSRNARVTAAQSRTHATGGETWTVQVQVLAHVFYEGVL